MKSKAISPAFIALASFILFNANLTAQQRKPIKRPVVQITGVPVTAAQVSTASNGTPLSPEKQKRVDSFRLAWQTIRDNYFDPTFSGLNWEDIRKEFEPRVEAATDDSQLYSLLEEMIGRLNKSHFAVIPPEVFKTIATAKKQAKAEPRVRLESQKTGSEIDDEAWDIYADVDDHAQFGLGLDLRILDNHFVISRVDKNSAAEYHGLKTGYIIEKINGVSLTDMLTRIDAVYKNKGNTRAYLPIEIVNSFLNGPEDTYVDLNYLDETDTPKDVHIMRERLPGRTVSIGKNFPEQYFRFEATSLSEPIGYIRFNIFAMPVIESFCDAVTKLKDKKAIIVDLRGNIGGILGTMVALGGMLTDNKIDLGTQMYRFGGESLVASTKPKHFNGRLVFLVDNQTISAAEIFSAALQENDRALVVGERTAGAALPSVTVKLPTGGALMYPIANYKTRNGNFIEGKGVQPNLEIALSRKDLLAGHDDQLDAALRIIQEDTAFPKPAEISIVSSKSALPPQPPAKIAPTVKGKVSAQTMLKAPIKAPPAAVERDFPPGKDKDSQRIISEFIGKIGGPDALEKITSYELKGSAHLVIRGADTDLAFTSLRQSPDKYGEFMNSDVTGDIRDIYSGKNHLVQADYGLELEVPGNADSSRAEILLPILGLLKDDTFPSLVFTGKYERLGRMTEVLEGKMEGGVKIGLGFDAETKLLVSFSTPYYSISFGDYRKVGDTMLPFEIEREYMMKIKFDEITLNPTIDPIRFMKKQNCFNIAN